MGVSDRIEAFITELLKEENSGDWLELRRNELASVFNCVPSQINYVIATRFSGERGYAVESRRGGGGYLRIRRIETDGKNPVFAVLSSVGNSLDYPSAKAFVEKLFASEAITKENAELILSAVSDNSLTIAQPDKDRLRSLIFKNMLTVLI